MELENAAPEIKQIAVEREESDADMDDEVGLRTHRNLPIYLYDHEARSTQHIQTLLLTRY